MDKKLFRKIVVYLSGAFAGINERSVAFNVAVAKAKAAQLWNMGFTVICPHSNAPMLVDGCLCHYEEYLMGDLELIDRSDCLLMLKGWESSRGSVIEHDYAIQQGIPVFLSINDLYLKAVGGEIICLKTERGFAQNTSVN